MSKDCACSSQCSVQSLARIIIIGLKVPSFRKAHTVVIFDSLICMHFLCGKLSGGLGRLPRILPHQSQDTPAPAQSLQPRAYLKLDLLYYNQTSTCLFQFSLVCILPKEKYNLWCIEHRYVNRLYSLICTHRKDRVDQNIPNSSESGQLKW